MKKVLSYIFTICLLLTNIEVSTIHATEETTISDVHVNPLYASEISVDSLNKPRKQRTGVSTYSLTYKDEEYAETIEEAGTLLRQGLKNRDALITLYFTNLDGDWESVLSGAFDYAFASTGVGDEGDYLQYTYLGYDMEGTAKQVGTRYYFTFPLTMTYASTLSEEQVVTNKINQLLNSFNFTDTTSDYTKVSTIYNYLCDHVTYDYTNLNDDSYKTKYSAYAALVNGTAVCQGYANAFYRMALQSGVDAKIISGLGDGSSGWGAHAWNIAKVGSMYYNLDATWDAGRSTKSYFLASDEPNTTFTSSHMRNEGYSMKSMDASGNIKYQNKDENQKGDYSVSYDYTSNDFYARYPMGTSNYEDCKGNHTYVKTNTVQPTCTTKGYEEYTCSACGQTKRDNEVDALGHDYVTSTIQPICTEQGYTLYTCSRCDDKYKTNYVDALDHIRVTDSGYEPTCTEPGGTEGSHCDRCGEVLVEQEKIPALGHDEVIDEAIEATCTNDGITEGKRCERCGEVLVQQEVIPATGHNYATVVTEPTCTTKGYTTYTCNDCGQVKIEDYVDVLGHTEGEAVIENKVEATCTEDGSYDEVTYCTVCNEELSRESKVIEKLGHTVVVDEAVEPTCTQSGLTEGSHCDRCGEVLVVQEIIPVTGHDYTTMVTEPTCLEKGYTTYTCSDCGQMVIKDYVDALGHTIVVDEAATPTCTKTGLTEGSHCSRCNEVLVAQEVIPALGHGETETIITNEKEVTCTEDGSMYEITYCTVCKDIINEKHITVTKLGHREVIDEAKDATCIETGLTEGKHCSRCNEVLVAQKVIPAKGHIAGEVVIENEVKATCAQDGSYDEVTYCTVCNEEINRETKTIPALEHTVVIDRGYEATCTEDGLTEGSHCSVCGKVLEPQTVIRSLGHPTITSKVEPTCTEQGYTQDVCSKCGLVVKRNFVDALGHQVVIDEGKEANCTQDGLTEGSHCSRCNEVLVAQEVIPALGHGETEIYIEIMKEPTCQEEGREVVVNRCTVCKETVDKEERPIPCLPHTPVIVEAVEPTCTTRGYTQYSYCEECGEIVEQRETIPKLGHNIVIDPAVETTCTEVGYTEGKHCDRCNEVLVAQEEIPAKGHNYTTVVVEPTCTTQGYTAYTCNDCGITHIDNYVEALGHDIVGGTVKEPTCVEDGIITGGYCQRCNTQFEDEIIPKLGHDIVVDEALEATCAHSGLTEGSHCGRCNDIIVMQELVPTKEHIPAEPVIKNKVEPTCTNKGSYDEVTNCKDCGEELSRTTHEISAKGHNYIVEITSPTCTTKGYTTYTCSDCNQIGIKDYVDALGHTTKVTTTKATFSAAGKKVTTCTVCNDTIKTVAIPKVSSATLASTTLVYSGSAKTPAVTVKDTKGKVLVKGTDYTVAYSNNKLVGKATAKITLKGNYSGTKSLTFTIKPKKAVISSITAGSRKMTVKMSTKVSATGGGTYQIQYRVKGTSKWKSTTTTAQSKAISSLTKGKKYSVRVRAYKSVNGTRYNGDWSTTKTSAAIK